MKAPKKDNLAEAKRIMERLVNTPPKPHLSVGPKALVKGRKTKKRGATVAGEKSRSAR